jgi:hypothetical protein
MSECWKLGIKVSGALSLDESDLANSRERSGTQTHLICNEFVRARYASCKKGAP